MAPSGLVNHPTRPPRLGNIVGYADKMFPGNSGPWNICIEWLCSGGSHIFWFIFTLGLMHSRRRLFATKYCILRGDQHNMSGGQRGLAFSKGSGLCTEVLDWTDEGVIHLPDVAFWKKSPKCSVLLELFWWSPSPIAALLDLRAVHFTMSEVFNTTCMAMNRLK